MTAPPAPWRLRGHGLVALRLVPSGIARAQVPPDVRLVPVLPNRSLALVLCARYGEGSTLRYSELIVAPGLVRARGRLGWWISHLWVDDLTALAGGRTIWGLPKQVARFRWAPDGRGVAVRDPRDESLLCALSPARDAPWRGGVPLPVLAPALCRKDSRLMHFGVRGRVRVRPTQGRLQLAPRALPLPGPSQPVRVLWLPRFALRVSAPR